MDGRAVDFENNQGTTICSPAFGHTSVCLLSSKFMFSQRRDHREKNVNFSQGSLSLFLFYSPHPASLRGHYAAESGGLTEQVYNVDTILPACNVDTGHCGEWTVLSASFLGYVFDIIDSKHTKRSKWSQILVHPSACTSEQVSNLDTGQSCLLAFWDRWYLCYFGTPLCTTKQVSNLDTGQSWLLACCADRTHGTGRALASTLLFVPSYPLSDQTSWKQLRHKWTLLVGSRGGGEGIQQPENFQDDWQCSFSPRGGDVLQIRLKFSKSGQIDFKMVFHGQSWLFCQSY